MERWKRSLVWSKAPGSGKLMKRTRILALDYGTKRIGVALSDELGWTAQPLETFERRTLDQDLTHIGELVSAHDVERVILGFPLQLDGREGPAAQAMREFAARLEESLSVPLVLWDERMTTKAAEDLLIAADVSRKKRKGAVDRIAAALLLQSYLAALDGPPAQERDDLLGYEQGMEETRDEVPNPSRSSADHSRRDRHRRLSRHRVG
jgi:putative Holliday junction resolvase